MAVTGKIKKIFNGKALVEFTRNSACGKCGKCADALEKSTIEIEADNFIQAGLNDTVEIEQSGMGMLNISFIIYVIPLACFISGVSGSYLLLTSFFGLNNYTYLLSFLSGIVFMTAVSLLLFYFLKKKNKIQCSLKIVKIIKKQ